jgi:hypothetical protein
VKGQISRKNGKKGDVESPMKHRNPEVFMGAPLEISEYETSLTDAEMIQGIVSRLMEK